MKISSFFKQAIRTLQFSLAALIFGIALNFGTAASLAAQSQVAPTPHLAIFGWGEKAQAKKIEGTAKQIDGRAKYDVGRVEDAGKRTAEKAGKMAKEIKKGSDKNLSKAGDSMKDAANNTIDGVEKIINK